MNPKIKLFVEGRSNVFATLKKSISTTDSVIWMHVASLGEYEQGLPILEQLKKNHPKYKILLTFFSPSGYEVKKNTESASIITYLPLDTPANARKFIALVRPKIALFIKYEIWPNYLKQLQKHKTPTFLVSALFSRKQIYFRWYGSFMRKSLSAFHYFFVQDKSSKQLLHEIGLNNVSISGDTRFDRVTEILKRNNELHFMQNFKQNSLCFVAGSSWPEDEEIIVDFINTTDKKIKYVIAPHNIKKEHIKNLKAAILKKTLCYSQIENKDFKDYDVLLIDTVGLLTKIYSYGSMAYVGGGFKTGLHNTLEPAVFGIPILIGPNYKGFKEAEDLVLKGGIVVVKNKENLKDKLNKFVESEGLRKTTGKINTTYINSNTGATVQIMKHLAEIL